MSFKRMLRRLVLGLVLGGHSVLGIGMNREKIEELMYETQQTRIEVTISEDDDKDDSTYYSER